MNICIMAQEEPVFFSPFLRKIIQQRSKDVVLIILAGSRGAGDHPKSLKEKWEGLLIHWLMWEPKGFLRLLSIKTGFAILRGLECGEFFGFEGEMLQMPANKMAPVTGQPTPLLIGGHAEPALKRAARLGDGWMCAGADMAQLQAYIGRINQLRNEYGTADQPFRIFTTGQDAFTPEGLAKLEEIGVTDVVIGFRTVYEMEPDKSLDEKIAMLNWYAGDFINK